MVMEGHDADGLLLYTLVEIVRVGWIPISGCKGGTGSSDRVSLAEHILDCPSKRGRDTRAR